MNHLIRPTGTLTQFCICVLLVGAFFVGKGVAVNPGTGCSVPQFSGIQTNVKVGISPRSMAAGDFNHDGRNDLAVANYGSSQGAPDGGISVLLNNGSGSFSTQNNISVGINPRSIATADLNNDGHSDLVVLNNVSGSCCISGFATILMGDGTGNFTSGGPPISVGSDPTALTVGDFNNDGKADLAATISAFRVSILVGNGAGSFGTSNTFTVDGNATSIAAGDLNADGKLDLVTGNLNSFSISVLLGDGTGGFGSSVKYGTTGNPGFVALGDLNHDSKLDVVTANTLNNVSVLLGSGTGSFSPPTLFTVASSPESVILQDFNGDSHLDLATANGGEGTVSVLIGNGNGSFGSLTSYGVGGSPLFVTSSEINGDGKPDLLVANASSNSVSILISNGAGGFTGARTFNVGLSPLSVSGGDFNGDGTIDLAVPNAGQNSVSILLGDGSGSFAAEVRYPAGFSPVEIVVGDYNRDGKLDLAVANSTCCENKQSVSILLGDGSGGFGARTAFSAGTGASAIVSADFNNDGTKDLAVVNNADQNISLLLGTGNGTFAEPVNFALPGSPNDLATGDFNGDGNTDLVITAGYVFVALGNGSGSFSIEPLIPTPGAISVAVGDLDGNGHVDLVTANSTGSLSVILGDGSSHFGTPRDIPIDSPRDISLGDFNNDGNIDIAASNSSRYIGILQGDGAGNFGTTTSFNSGGASRGILAKDFNNDGRLDLVAADLAGYVSILLNLCSEGPVAVPGIAIGDASLIEGHSGQTNALLLVTLSTASKKTVIVNYYTIDQSATNDNDYQSASGQVIFSPGATSQIISIPVWGDTNVEPNEIFLVQLRDGVNGNIVVGQGKATIQNDDETPSPLQLILDESGPDSSQAAALDAILFLRDPFPVVNSANLLNQSQDRNTRVIILIANLQLTQGETSFSVGVNLVGSNNQNYDVAAEDVRIVPGFSFAQVTFRLPDTLAPGTCTIKVKAHGQESNSGTIRIRS